jgi:hypothetical protein
VRERQSHLVSHVEGRQAHAHHPEHPEQRAGSRAQEGDLLVQGDVHEHCENGHDLRDAIHAKRGAFPILEDRREVTEW